MRRGFLNCVLGIKNEDIPIGLGECSVTGSWCQGGGKRRILESVSGIEEIKSHNKRIKKEWFAKCVTRSRCSVD